MAAVTRLVTYVDIDDDHDDAHRMSMSARLDAVLADGRRVVLLDDRGWSESPVGETSVADTARTARDVVGPDEAFAGRTQADMNADHWRHLTRLLRGRGVAVEAAELRALPHDVELSDRALARCGAP